MTPYGFDMWRLLLFLADHYASQSSKEFGSSDSFGENFGKDRKSSPAFTNGNLRVSHFLDICFRSKAIEPRTSHPPLFISPASIKS